MGSWVGTCPTKIKTQSSREGTLTQFPNFARDDGDVIPAAHFEQLA